MSTETYEFENSKQELENEIEGLQEKLSKCEAENEKLIQLVKDLTKGLEKGDAMIRSAVKVLQDHIDPASTMSNAEAIGALMGIFDNETSFKRNGEALILLTRGRDYTL